MTCHYRLWKAHTFKQRRAWIEITALGLHARLDDVGCGMTSRPLDNTQLNYVKRGMISPPLYSTHGRQCRAWHDITAL